jgi:hypothetical protein
MFRKFCETIYPIPGLETAVEVLRPGAKWDMDVSGHQQGKSLFTRWEDDQNREPPTWNEIEEEVLRERRIYDWFEWERQRERLYPDWRDQFDMLYNDIKSGNIENGTWIAAIEKVKREVPKPEGDVPN